MLSNTGRNPIAWHVAAVWALMPMSLTVALSSNSETPIVYTSSGPVRGLVEQGRHVFRGIPYAAPPVGDLRFKPPTGHPGWAQLDAYAFGPACLQYATGCWNSSNVTIQSEDCLTVNIMTPERPSTNGSYAVVVFMHAGEFRCGCSNDAESNWPNFGDEVVFVSFNYRLGAMGFLGDVSLRFLDPKGSTGNYGLLDQRFLLNWVHDNIAAFGGNPSDVSIMGESSGGTSVAFHLLAAGRGEGQPFQKAILQSPGMGQVREWEDAQLNAKYVLAVLAAARSPYCFHTFGYVSFPDNFIATRSPLHVDNHTNVMLAKSWCFAHANCSGFLLEKTKAIFVSGVATVFDVEAKELDTHPTVYLKQGPQQMEHRRQCLVAADARRLTDLTGSMPKDDTFYTDGWAPVVDAVTIPETLEEQLATTGVPEDVDVLVGSNLDEGTEFMSLAPSIACNASEADFQKWIESFLGQDVENKIMELYAPANLTRPLPACQKTDYMGRPIGEKINGEEAVYYNAAMRIAGDVSIVCPSVRLAQAVRGKAFAYTFSMTPNLSWNFDDTQIMGAFHGSEVPFVFGTMKELKTAAEQELSKKMSCYWSSFARNADPSKDSCASTPWPVFDKSSQTMMQLSAIIQAKPQDDLAAARCSALTSYKARFSRKAFFVDRQTILV
mmetsp:Transcript_105336/g.187255  ORF Transcript_105336/g.187255 Transcript_105336/m.187255 type:complete len:664 (-) Transcript_105336:230-2221(-)